MITRCVPVLDIGSGLSVFFEEKGNGQPVVFVHGTVGDYRCWLAQTAALSPSFRTIAYSRRFARPNKNTGSAKESTVQNNARDLESLVKALGMGQVHLVGHSYGGFIAAYFSTIRPEMLRSLTLVNAAVATILVKSLSSEELSELLLRSPVVGFSFSRLLDGTIASLKAINAGDGSAAMRLLVPALDDHRLGLPPKPEGFSEIVIENSGTLEEVTTVYPSVTAQDMAKVTTPTLVICGELSAAWDLRISEMVAASIPNCKSAKIPGAGHFCFLEKPQEVNEYIKTFLLEHS